MSTSMQSAAGGARRCATSAADHARADAARPQRRAGAIAHRIELPRGVRCALRSRRLLRRVGLQAPRDASPATRDLTRIRD